VIGRPLENRVGESGSLLQQLPAAEAELVTRTRLEWLFPVSLRGAGPHAFLLLGPKRSEEPCSREDRELLEAVTASLSLLLDREASAGFAECGTCGRCHHASQETCSCERGRLVRSPYARTIAGRYRFDRRLGRGGVGVVYEAFDTKLRRAVAVKVLRADVTASAEALARFRREARVAASLSHPNVVRVHDFGVADDDRAYLVMELLRGRSLREELNLVGRLDQARALSVLRDAASAVSLAHENGLVHRDLKPENIFLSQTDRGEVATILDFGLAKPLAPRAADTVGETMAGAAVGTPAYMSPEQRLGADPREAWDVWALTVIAHELLTGAYPFAQDASGGKALAGSNELPPRLAKFFEAGFSPDPARRPASVPRFLNGLEEACAAPPSDSAAPA
jgi:eukaryotic-like serine/threonine-protein kinase